jgi:DNA-binding IclR family transcriptional regulator
MRAKLAAAIRQRLPAFETASAKAMPGFMTERILQHILDRGMLRYTPFTVHAKEVIWDNLKMIKEVCFAISEQEYEEQINALAAPIFDLERQSIESIAAAGPAYRLTNTRMVEIRPKLIATAQDITREITMAAIPLENSSIEEPISIGNIK